LIGKEQQRQAALYVPLYKNKLYTVLTTILSISAGLVVEHGEGRKCALYPAGKAFSPNRIRIRKNRIKIRKRKGKEQE
jgi:hypothetical protein